MNRLITSIVACACAGRLTAQSIFVNIYDAGAAGRFSLLEQPSGNILSILAYNSTVNVAGTSILSPNGSILHSQSYAIDTFLVIQSIKRASTNEFYVAGGYYKNACTSNPSATIVHPAICRMDSLGNMQDARYYVLNSPACQRIAGDLEVLSDGSIVAWGREGAFYFFKASSIGSVVWARSYSQSGRVRFIKEIPNGDLLVGFETPTAGASLARIHTNGNFVWCKSYMRPQGTMSDAIVVSDSSFVISGFTSTSASAQLFVMNLDGDGEVQWCRGYGGGAFDWYTPQWSRLERTLDGNYAVLATLGQGGFFFRPFLMKTNVNGDTLWSRSMGADGYLYKTLDLLVASDGGYVFSGIVWGNLPDMNTGLPYVFKTDSLGQFPCLSRSHPVQLFDLFPSDSSFTLTYLVGATAHPAFITDTTSTPISVYDACEVANAVRPYPDYKRERMRVRPNPNDGRFTMTVPAPMSVSALTAERYYSVYNAQSKLLFQRPMPQGQSTEEIDLSRFGAGTYVVRFTDKEGSCYERVVVE